MQLSIQSPALFQVFRPVEGNPELAEAGVILAKKGSVKLSGIGNSVIELPYFGAELKSGQTIQFDITGKIQGEPHVVKAKPKSTAGQSPAFSTKFETGQRQVTKSVRD